MTRLYYRLSLTILCALAGYITPVFTLRYPYVLGHFVGALAASFLAWLFLVAALVLEPGVHPGIQAILGVGAGVISWAHIAFVAAFHVIPLVIQSGGLNDTFDPVWVVGGLSPLILPVTAVVVTRSTGKPFWQSLASALWRFSVPLALLEMIPRLMGLPRQYRWLFLFTGVMFLVLDGLGTGGDWPLVPRRKAR